MSYVPEKKYLTEKTENQLTGIKLESDYLEKKGVLVSAANLEEKIEKRYETLLTIAKEKQIDPKFKTLNFCEKKNKNNKSETS